MLFLKNKLQSSIPNLKRNHLFSKHNQLTFKPIKLLNYNQQQINRSFSYGLISISSIKNNSIRFGNERKLSNLSRNFKLEIEKPILEVGTKTIKNKKRRQSIKKEPKVSAINEDSLIQLNNSKPETTLKNDGIVTEITNNSIDLLRPYQKECIQATLDHFEKGTKRLVVSLPVGTGKTVIMAHLIPRVPQPNPKATKVLVLAHRQELLFQAMSTISKFNPNLKVDLERGNYKCDLDSVDVVVASVQSLGYSSSIRLKRYDPKLFKAVIIDEAHHASASTYQKVLRHFNLISLPNTTDSSEPKLAPLDYPLHLWGCSATLRRHDGIGLGTIFDYIPYHRDFLDMVKEKWLCDVRVTTIKTTVDLSGIGVQGGDFVASQLAITVDTPQRNELIAHTFRRLAESRKSTIVFCVNIKHAENLSLAFTKAGIESTIITSKTPSDLRTDYLDQFRSQKIKVLINCAILTEGFDVPSVDCVIMARPTHSRPLYQQMLGRGMRPFPTKSDCLVLDFVDILKNKTLCTTPTLLGYNHDHVMQSEKLTTAIDVARNNLVNNPKEEKEIKVMVPPAIKTIRIKHFNKLEELAKDDMELVTEVNRISKLEWVPIDKNTYVLGIKEGIIRIELDSDELYIAKFKRKLPEILIDKLTGITHTKPSNLPIQADNLESIIKATDTFLSKKYPNSMGLAMRSAMWRRDKVSEAQLSALGGLVNRSKAMKSILAEMGIETNKEDTEKKEKPKKERKGTKKSNLQAKELFGHLTKGQAANLITLAKEGGVTQYLTELNAMVKSKNIRLKQKQLHHVQVGPIS